MGSIVDWQRAGVGLKVELSETPQLVLYADVVPGAVGSFTPGGSENVPLGWIPGFWGTQNPGTSATDFNTAGGIFAAYTVAQPGTTSFSGAYIYVDAVPGVRYQFQIERRVIAGRNETASLVSLSEWNPTTQQENALAGTGGLTITNTNWESVSLQAGRAVNYAGGFTQLRIRVDGAGSNTGTTRNWGVEYQKPVLFARNIAMPTITWRDITCDVKALDTRYGRERYTNRYDVASMQLVLDNSDGRYSFADPHPFNFGPGRQIRATATYDGTTYPIAYCIVDQISDGVTLDGLAVTNVSALDPTTVASNQPVPAVGGGGMAGGLRMRALLDVVGYLLYTVDNGVFTMQPISASGRAIRDEMGLMGDSEGGAVFAERDGRIIFKDRTWVTKDDNLKSVTANLWAKPSSDQPYFDNTPDQPGLPTLCMNGLQTDWSLNRVINSLSLANVGGVAREYEDKPSIRQHGARTYQRHDFLLMQSADLDYRAADIMTGYTQPKMRLNSLSYRADLDENDWHYTLRVFLNWLVRVWYQNARTGWGWLMVTHVQSVAHHITPTEWVTTLTVDQPTYYADAPQQDVIAWDDPRAHWDTTAVWV